MKKQKNVNIVLSIGFIILLNLSCSKKNDVLPNSVNKSSNNANTSNARLTGFTWTSQKNAPNGNWITSCFIDASTGFIAGEGGTLAFTANGGSTYTTISTGTTNDIYSIYFVKTTLGAYEGYIAGNNGLFMYTTKADQHGQPQFFRDFLPEQVSEA